MKKTKQKTLILYIYIEQSYSTSRLSLNSLFAHIAYRATV